MSVTLLIGDAANELRADNSRVPPMTSSGGGDVIAPGKPRVSSALTEDQPSKVRCFAVGGYPPPRLEVRVDPCVRVNTIK